MCHNAPWLSALDKQMWLQFAPKESKADVMSEFWSSACLLDTGTQCTNPQKDGQHELAQVASYTHRWPPIPVLTELNV